MKTRIVTVLIVAILSAQAYSEKTLVPFPIDWSKTGPSMVDLSGYLDAPAGRRGFLRVRGKHIYTPEGKRFRIWGTNICGPDCFPDKDLAPLIASDLARMGVNCVRFHQMDCDWGRSAIDLSRNDTRHLDPTNMDLFDFFVAELKKRGIYTNINLNVLRNYKEGDGVRDHELLGIGKSATYFNKRLIELQQEYATQILTHYNSYTGNQYCREPAVAVVEVVNENSVLEAWASWRLDGRDDRAGLAWSPIPVSYHDELTGMYNEWLKRNRSLEELTTIREEIGLSKDRPIPRLKPSQFAAASELRFHSEATFYMMLEVNFFRGMKGLLKDKLGVRSILVGSADHNDSICGYLHICSNLVFDMIDRHGYWQPPLLGGVTRILNAPMVNQPMDSTVVQFARTPIKGRPFTISETNHPFPHEYACEGYPILTAYALFHDWDGIYWFNFGHGRRNSPNDGIQKNGWFDYSNDPVKMTNLYACGLMWHRKDLQPARQDIVRSYTSKEMIETLRTAPRWSPFFTYKFPRSAALRHSTHFAFDGTPVVTYPPVAPPSNIQTDTRQIAWMNADKGKGLVTVEASNTQALIGFVRDSGKPLENFEARIDNEFCSLVLTSLDHKAIPQSDLMLLTATAMATNTGIKWEDDGVTLSEWGSGPVVIEPVTGTVTLRNLQRAKGLNITPLTAEGHPLDPVEGSSEQGRYWQLPLGSTPTTWYVIRVSR